MKKLLSLILIFTLLLGVSGAAAPLYTYEEVIPISESITLRKVEAFYSGHNLAYSVIRADLSDENTSLRLLKSDKGATTLDTVGNLAKTEENVVAALNADFFSFHKGNQGFSLGIEVEDGTLLASPINPSTMATVSYMDDILSMSYLDFHCMVVAPNWQYSEVRHMNKHTAYYGDILLYTSDFADGMSPAPGGEVLEVVVEDGKIREFRRNMPPVAIPENGCVLVVSEGVNMFFANNFAVGDPIRFDYYITPNVKEADVAFGGGAMLVENGQARTTFSHTVDGYNPRSAIGTDKSGKTLYLVAVDGRQKGSRGMTMAELARLMQSLGCHTAVNLDGGGSTRMLASTVWEEDMHAVHAPTENRPVINAVGLTYTAEKSACAGILLESDKAAVGKGGSVEISAAAYDANMRPVEDAVTLSSKDGQIENGVFTPSHGGACTVEATCGGVREEIEIFVVDEICGMEAPRYLRLLKGETATLDLEVYDKDGHFVPCESLLGFTVSSSNPSVASFDGEKVVANGNGTAILSVSKDGAISYVSIAVGHYEETETMPLALLEEGRLAYAFSEETESAQLSLSKTAVLAKDANVVSVSFRTEADFAHAIHLALTDKNGEALLVPFTGSFEKGTWQQLSASIPKEAARPLRIDGICISRKEGGIDSGEIYLDALTYPVDTAFAFPTAPQNVYAVPASLPKTDFAVATKEDGTALLAGLVNDKTEKTLSAFAERALLESGLPFSVREGENALYITANTDKGSIRATDKNAWDKIADAIEKTTKPNVFLLCTASPFGDDAFENRVLCDYLASLSKNVFVISRGDGNTVKNIGGVYYFTVGTSSQESLSAAHIKSKQVLAFSLGETPSFAFQNLY